MRSSWWAKDLKQICYCKTFNEKACGAIPLPGKKLNKLSMGYKSKITTTTLPVFSNSKYILSKRKNNFKSKKIGMS